MNFIIKRLERERLNWPHLKFIGFSRSHLFINLSLLYVIKLIFSALSLSLLYYFHFRLKVYEKTTEQERTSCDDEVSYFIIVDCLQFSQSLFTINSTVEFLPVLKENFGAFSLRFALFSWKFTLLKQRQRGANKDEHKVLCTFNENIILWEEFNTSSFKLWGEIEFFKKCLMHIRKMLLISLTTHLFFFCWF